MRRPLLINNVVVYEAGLNIDSDGSPRSYGPNNSGLDYTNNAGGPGNYFGILTDNNGHPIIQEADSPCPGMYISSTSLQDHSKSLIDPLRYVDSEKVPYISIASDLIHNYKIMMGDLAYVYNRATSKGVSAVCADVGPRFKYSEGSIYLAQQLGIKNVSPRNGGCNDGIITLIFINSHSSWPLTNAIIDELSKSLLEQAGGIEKFL